MKGLLKAHKREGKVEKLRAGFQKSESENRESSGSWEEVGVEKKRAGQGREGRVSTELRKVQGRTD